MSTSPKTTRALQKTQGAPGAVLREVPLKELGPQDVLIKIEIAGICGSDPPVYEWRPTAASLRRTFPFTMGHEFSGQIIEVGSQVKSLVPGDRVAGETHGPCGHCYQCQTGEPHICSKMKLVGATIDGCFADYTVLPEVCTIKLTDSITPRQGALMEPMGVAVHSVTEAQVSGLPVAILGAGPIGLMAVAAARHLGATQVIATARTPAKLETAKAMGATTTLNPKHEDVVKAVLDLTSGVGAGAVIDFTGDPEAIKQGLGMLRPRGRLVMVAQLKGPLGPELSHSIIFKEQVLTGIFGRRMYDTWLLVSELLGTGKVDVARVTGNQFRLADYETAFKEAADNSMGRVLLVP